MSVNPRSYQSLRSSCDRCRFQKLRCNLSSDTGSTPVCQRCLRAQVSCVFSRRARSGPYPKKQESIDMQTVNTPAEMRLSASPSECLSNSPLPWLRKAATSSVESFTLENNGPPVPHMDTTSPDGMLHINDRSDEAMFSAGGVDWWSQSNSLIPDIGLLDGCALQYKPTSSPEEQRTFELRERVTSRDGFINTTDADSIMVGMPQAQENTTHVPKLTALLLEMHNYSRVLQGYRFSNAKEAETSLNDYPIGDVLYLSQWFCTILACCRPYLGESSRSQTLPGLRDAAPVNGQDVFNTPTLLLILSCYITMTHIYSIVFGHLQEYLLQLPDAVPQQTQVELRRGLRLGELPLANETCARTEKAVGTLLDALHCAENFIGLPRDIRSTAAQDMWRDPSEDAAGGAWALKDGLAITLRKQETLVREVKGGFEEGVTEGVKEELSELKTKIERVRELLKGQLDSL